MAKSSKKNKEAPLEPVIESVLTFDGQDDFITCPEGIVNSSYTKQAWVKLAEPLAQNNNILSGRDHTLFMPNGGCLASGHNNQWWLVKDSSASPANTWLHVAVTYDSQTQVMCLYRDGGLISQASNVPPFTPSDRTLLIGSHRSSALFKGQIAEARIWNKVLSQAEIQENMPRRLRGDEAGLVSYWQLNEGTGAIAQDKTSNANHGTIHGNPTWEVSTLSLVDATPSQSEEEASSPETPIQEIDSAGSASASPNVSPSPSPVSTEQFIPIEQGELGEAATAPPNVAPTPSQPSGESLPPVTPAPAIAQPIPPVALQGRQMVLVLDEKHQGISAGSGALRPQGRFTIEAWVHPATDAGKQVIFAEGGALFYLEGGELKFHTRVATEAIALSATPCVIASVNAGITSGSWYHVAVARAGRRPGKTKLYINGIHNDNQTAISPVLAFGNTYLGGDPDVPDSRFQGKLLEVRVWRYARSQAEIEANRLYSMTGRELGLVRCWSLNQIVGSILHDQTTNRAVGTLSGDAVWEEVEIPLKLKLDPQERLTRSTGLEDYGYWYKEMAKQQKTEADPPFLRGRIWA